MCYEFLQIYILYDVHIVLTNVSRILIITHNNAICYANKKNTNCYLHSES